MSKKCDGKLENLTKRYCKHLYVMIQFDKTMNKKEEYNEEGFS